MRVAKAKRRWVAWCRYIDRTQSGSLGDRRYGSDAHNGQVKAYWDLMYAHRYPPVGARVVWYPKWGNVRG